MRIQNSPMTKTIYTLLLTAVSATAFAQKALPAQLNLKGDFAGSPIVLKLNNIQNNISGTSEHKKVMRPVKGTATATEEGYTIHLKEPGNNQYDGQFHMVYNPVSKEAKGWWKANNQPTWDTVKYTLKVIK